MGFIDPGRNSRSHAIGKRKRKRKPISSTPSTRAHHTSPDPPAPRRSKNKKRTHSSSQSTTPLSRLESLPAELLYRIFETTYNLSLPRASLHLSHTFSAKHLQLNYIHRFRNDPRILSNAFTLRFFTAEFLLLWELKFGALDAAGTWIPMKVLVEPWSGDGVALFEALVERGAGLEQRDAEVHLGVLYSALVAGRMDVVRLLVRAGVRPDTESLRLAMKYTVGDEGDLTVCRLLVGYGADMGDVGVWRMALGLGRGVGGERAVEWLLEGAAPPGEVLGELSLR